MQGGRSDLFEGIRQGIRTEECGYPARPLRRVGNVYCGRHRDPKYGHVIPVGSATFVVIRSAFITVKAR